MEETYSWEEEEGEIRNRDKLHADEFQGSKQRRRLLCTFMATNLRSMTISGVCHMRNVSRAFGHSPSVCVQHYRSIPSSGTKKTLVACSSRHTPREQNKCRKRANNHALPITTPPPPFFPFPTTTICGNLDAIEAIRLNLSKRDRLYQQGRQPTLFVQLLL